MLQNKRILLIGEVFVDVHLDFKDRLKRLGGVP